VGNHDSYCGLPVVRLSVIIFDDQRPGVAATLAAIDTARITAGDRPDVRRVAYRTVQPLHNRYMSKSGIIIG
jgi:hypothetical protein